jgi:hypothetical protein
MSRVSKVSRVSSVHIRSHRGDVLVLVLLPTGRGGGGPVADIPRNRGGEFPVLAGLSSTARGGGSGANLGGGRLSTPAHAPRL